eukprot:m.28542 g.28542  ORF g.28542 m.28542 type:complete len:170 (-) comp6564_c0_seq2:291-800(-)
MPEQVLWAVVCYDNRIQFNSLYHDESCFCLSFVHFLLVLVWLDMSNLFIVACRERTLIYLEPNHDDLVQTVVDTIAQLVKEKPDDVRLCFKGSRLEGKKTLKECDISLEGELPVEPIKLHFVFRVPDTEDDWEEPHTDEMSQPAPLPDTLQQPDMAGGEGAPAPAAAST